MKKLILIFSIVTLPIISYGQISEKQFIENIEWLNDNPSLMENEEFVSKVADLVKFQFFNYPNSFINTSGTKEIDKKLKGYKYENYLLFVYSFNQLHYKLKNKRFNTLEACTFSIKKLINSYLIIIKNEPELRINILDSYMKLNEKELKKKMKLLV